MRVTTWTEYSLIISLHLARRRAAGQGAIAARELAELERLPGDYAEQILLRLRRAGLVDSVRGAKGGYMLAREATAISVHDVMSAADHQTFEPNCEVHPVDAERCSPNSGCTIRPVWDALQQRIDSFLESVSLDDLMHEEPRVRALWPSSRTPELPVGAPSLSIDELLRYARHLTLPEVGIAGQGRLRSARVLLVGAGGLGSPAALYLAAAGVGTLGIVDGDQVDLSNLQRQIIHDTASVGQDKVASAAARIGALNPHVTVIPFTERLTSANARKIIAQFDLVVDGSDNFPTRYLVNDACVFEQKPLIYGSIFRFDGQLSVFATPGGPCYRCLFAEPPPPELVPSCVEAGVIGVLPGIIGSLQALEAIKWILKLGDSAVGRLVLFDALTLRFREIAVRRDPDCPVCGDAPTIREVVDYDAFCGVTSLAAMDAEAEITPGALSGALGSSNPPLIIDVREPWEFAIGHVAGSQLIPLHQLPERIAEIPPHRDIVTVCHHGQRSAMAAALLHRAGVSRVRNLTGGIDAWAQEVDERMPRY